jgi:hypothetical protein
MKTNTIRTTLLAGAAVALATALSIPAASAGPGPDYWRNLGRTDSKAAVAPTSVERAARVCADARLVSVTETKPSWQNRRGPLTTVEIGKKLECASCDTPLVVMKPSGHNGRGGMAPVEIKGRHDCTKDGCGATVATLH